MTQCIYNPCCADPSSKLLCKQLSPLSHTLCEIWVPALHSSDSDDFPSLPWAAWCVVNSCRYRFCANLMNCFHFYLLMCLAKYFLKILSVEVQSMVIFPLQIQNKLKYCIFQFIIKIKKMIQLSISITSRQVNFKLL